MGADTDFDGACTICWFGGGDVLSGIRGISKYIFDGALDWRCSSYVSMDVVSFFVIPKSGHIKIQLLPNIPNGAWRYDRTVSVLCGNRRVLKGWHDATY